MDCKFFRTMIFIFIFLQGHLAYGDSIEFIILGVITSNDTNRGIALVKAKKDNKVSAFKVGSKLDSDTTLTDVKRRHVELTIKGKPFIVNVGDDNLVSFKKRPVHTAKTQGGELEKIGETVKITSAYKDHIIGKNLSQVLMQAATEPYLEDGRIKGFRLWEIDKDSIYERVGFSNGDVITHINEQPLTDAGNAIRILNQLKNAQSVNVTFLHRGMEKNLTISVQ